MPRVLKVKACHDMGEAKEDDKCNRSRRVGNLITDAAAQIVQLEEFTSDRTYVMLVRDA